MRKAAYQSLGPFITTFQEDKGEDTEGAQPSSLEPANSSCEQNPDANWAKSGEGEGCTAQQMRNKDRHSGTSDPLSCQENASSESSETWIEKQLKVVSQTECVGVREHDGGRCESTEYNDILFWRQPIPDLDLNLLNNSSSHLLVTEEVGRRKGESEEEEKKEEEVRERGKEEEEEEEEEVRERGKEEEEVRERGKEEEEVRERGKEENGVEEKKREDKRLLRRAENSKDAPSLEDKDVVEERFGVHFEDDVISDSTGREGPTALHSLLPTPSHEMLMHSTPAPHNNLASSSDMDLTIQTDHSAQPPLLVSSAG